MSDHAETGVPCFCSHGHRKYEFDPAKVWVECDECGAWFDDATNTGGLSAHAKGTNNPFKKGGRHDK